MSPSSRSDQTQAFLQQLKSLNEREQQELGPACDIDAMLIRRSRQIDEILIHCWAQALGSHDGVALVAVGGYGRSELFPQSDIDVLILTDESDTCNAGIHAFLHTLWDLGLNLSHSVRTLDECIEEGLGDITVATNYQDARWLTGNQTLFHRFRERIASADFWPPLTFLKAKLAEQQARHAKYDDTGFKIEPNVKESPGGLRDIHTVRWIAARMCGARSLHDMHEAGLLTDAELRSLQTNLQHLSRIRMALHLMVGRPEERLLLAYQKDLAARFGYEADTEGNLGVERFMQDYFRVVTETERLNGLLIQVFEETLGYDENYVSAIPIPINPRFQIRHGFLETTHAQVFMQSPTALFEVFLLLAQNPQLKGISSATIRQLRANLSVIDAGFRKNATAKRLFLDILKSDTGVFAALRSMNRFGVLAAYIPQFGAIVGRMQFDLYHLYTVDEHTLFVIRNLQQFALEEVADEHPQASAVFKRIDQPWLLYLAGLFHDIAKGRGGKHNVLGAIDARQFCLAHGIPAADTELVSWLVREHLTMSFTAQRQDIEDPEVIADFARTVGDQRHLDYLYLLTVADIRATNPKLWNSWRENLLDRLYQYCSEYFEHGAQSMQDILESTRASALAQAKQQQLDQTALTHWLAALPEDYFLRYEPEEIVHHAQVIIDQPEPVVAIAPHPASRTTQVLIYSQPHPALFAQLAARIDQERLDVQAANLTLVQNGRMLIEFFILDRSGQQITDEWLLRALRERLLDAINHPERPLPGLKRRLPRELKPFNVPTTVSFSRDEARARTLLQVVTKDRPGLLARLADALWRANVRLLHARISTLGERVEDAFFIVDDCGLPVDDPDKQAMIRNTLLASLADDD